MTDISRRLLLRGLFATPALIAIERLMPVRALAQEPWAGLAALGDAGNSYWLRYEWKPGLWRAYKLTVSAPSIIVVDGTLADTPSLALAA